MATKLKSVFLEPSVKRIIELNMSLKSIPTRNDALVDMLKESNRYNELINMLSQFNTPQQSVALSDSGENSPKDEVKLDKINVTPTESDGNSGYPETSLSEDNILELSKKSVDELVKDVKGGNEYE